MTISKSGQKAFRPKARLLVLLGEQLITNEVIAVVELVKNAYDADATRVDVELQVGSDLKDSQIVVTDDGSGMSLDTILDVWLEPATDFRKKQREHEKRTPKLGRFPLGEKGVGRFAAHKLGGAIEVVTRADGSDDEVTVEVDWRRFEMEEYLEDVPVKWAARSPEIFTGRDHGTRITIRDLRTVWTANMIGDLHARLQALNSPFAESLDFRVRLIAPSFSSVLKELPEWPGMLDKAVYSLQGEVDENGTLDYQYSFLNPAFPQLARKEEKKVDVREAKVFKGRKTWCGPFKVRFFVWDLDPATLRETIERTYYSRYVKPHTGIRIYRDGFRVWPYGEPGDDSFGLDGRRVNFPTRCLSRNQLIGIIEISYTGNPELRDKTDREGLIQNREYEDLKELFIGCLSEVEAERAADKKKVNALREKTRPEDAVYRSIKVLKDRMTKKRHIDIYSKDVKRIESAYTDRMREILETFYVQAGLGIAYTLPVHELSRNLKDIDGILESAIKSLRETGASEDTVEKLNKAVRATDVMEDLVEGVGRLAGRGRPSTIPLGSVVKDAMDIMRTRLEKDGVKIECVQKDKATVKGPRNLLVTALLNLLDNSGYWLQRRESGRAIVITVDRDGRGIPRIIVSDNGPGIHDDPSLIVEPFFSRKPFGSGLGLYIVDRIMREAFHGEFRVLQPTGKEEPFRGARVALVFLEATEGR